MRFLALDLGSVRIGLALSDALGLTAQPLGALERVGPRKDLDRLARLVHEHGVTRVVIGLPLRLSGEEGSGSAAAREFADRLRHRLGETIEIELWDERLSTVEAERTLISAQVSRKRRRQVVDSLAAALILQSYLEARTLPGQGTSA